MPVNIVSTHKVSKTARPDTTSSAILVKKQIDVGGGSNSFDFDDEFRGVYFDPTTSNNAAIVLRPPYEPRHLVYLCEHNNSLGQLIEAMEVNIDGTSYEFVARDGTEVDDKDPEKVKLDNFFDEVWPGMSFTTLRRKVRVDQEMTGNAYIEIVRSLAGEITFLRPLSACTMRLVRLDEATPVFRSVYRNGKLERVRMVMRERRFVQMVGNKLMHFKPYGSERQLNKETGEWADNTLAPELRATEVIHLTARKPTSSPYGQPRWANNIPSVLGSRKAEEHNLEFFEAGGMPPAMIFIAGGALSVEAKKAMQKFLNNTKRNVHRAGVFDIHSTGSLDSANAVKVSVERFGAERQNDSMFENYDAKCEQRVRGAFRMPPMFVGKAGDYSFATAYASYMVAEAQVFQPEREEFDEVMNTTIMRELSEKYVLRSLPLTVKDVENQLKALDMLKDKLPPDILVEGVNEVTGMALPTEFEMPVVGGVVPEPEEPEATPVEDEDEPVGGGNVVRMPAVKSLRGKAQKAVFNLVADYAATLLKGDSTATLDEIVEALPPHQREQFDAALTLRLMSGIDHDREGAVELMGAAVSLMGCGHSHD